MVGIPVQGQENTDVSAQWAGRRKKGKFLLPLPVYSIQTLNKLQYASPHWVGGVAIYLIESIDSNANLIWKHPGKHSQK